MRPSERIRLFQEEQETLVRDKISTFLGDACPFEFEVSVKVDADRIGIKKLQVSVCVSGNLERDDCRRLMDGIASTAGLCPSRGDVLQVVEF